MPLDRSTLNHVIFIAFLILVFYQVLRPFADNIQFHEDIQFTPSNTTELGHHRHKIPEVFHLSTTKLAYRNATAHLHGNVTTLLPRNSTSPAYSSATGQPHANGTGSTHSNATKRLHSDMDLEHRGKPYKGGNKNGGGTTNNCYNCSYEDKATFESADDKLVVGMGLLAFMVGWFV
ncbi:hypothetical protein NpNSSI1_00000438 [Neofusicoccum parvum]|nr:hypothetical protein NpNSSI1_00000438 [Neofusicoccum parvum]